MTRPLRFGLVGTGHWARSAHAPALAASAGGAAATRGRRHRVRRGLGPQRQRRRRPGGRLSRHAAPRPRPRSWPASTRSPSRCRRTCRRRSPSARPGRASTCCWKSPSRSPRRPRTRWPTRSSQARVASVVFFTARFQADVRAWLADVTAGRRLGRRPARSGWARPCGRAARSTPRGGGTRAACGTSAPHVISLLWASLGPVTVGDRGSRGGRRDPPHPAPRGGASTAVDRHAQRTRERRGRPPGAVGTGGPVGRPAGDRPADRAAAHRPDRTGRQRPVRAAQPPVRRPVRPGRWSRSWPTRSTSSTRTAASQASRG